MRKRIQAAHIVLEKKVISGTLSWEDGQIIGIDEHPVQNEKAAWLMPGLIDFHTHGFSGVNVSKTPDANAALTMAELLPQFGVTAFLPATVASPQLMDTLGALAEAVSRQKRGALILGIYSEGPFYSPQHSGGTPTEYFSSCQLQLAQQLWEASAHQIRVMAMAPELKGSEVIQAYLKKCGVLCSIGHTGASLQQTQQAIDQGYALATHLFNAMPPLHHRQSGPAGVLLDHSDFPCELNCDFLHVSPLMVRLTMKLKSPEALIMISDNDSLSGRPAGRYQQQGLRQIVGPDGTIRLEDGTIYGSGKTLLQDIGNLAGLGVPLPDILRMASLNPARLLNEEQRRGSLEKGKQADFFLVDEHGVIETWINGESVYRR